jgi:hypothetical protein
MRALLIAFVVLAGCALGRRLEPTTPVTLAHDEALIVIAIESPNLVTLSLCRDADLAACVSAGPISPSSPLQIYGVPSGRYCLMEARFSAHGRGSSRRGWTTDDALCFTAEAGALVYPGHLAVPGYRFSAHDMIREQLDGAYPSLHDRPITSVTPAH